MSVPGESLSARCRQMATDIQAVADHLDESYDQRQRSIATQASCVWTEDIDSVWHTACRHAFEFNNVGYPSANGFTFCCYCGGRLVEKAAA